MQTPPSYTKKFCCFLNTMYSVSCQSFFLTPSAILFCSLEVAVYLEIEDLWEDNCFEWNLRLPFQGWFALAGLCIGSLWNSFKKLHTDSGDISSVQFSSVAQSCLTLCDPMNRSTPGLPVHHQLLECTQTHIHRVSDAIQPSHPLSSPSPLAPNPSQHQSLFQWVNSSHEVAKVLEFQL